MLSATFVRNINAPDRDGHGGLGLTLRIKPASREEYCKSRAHGIRINGRKTKLGLGTHPVGTLAMDSRLDRSRVHFDTVPHTRNIVDPAKFNSSAHLPYALRVLDFQASMQDVYDLFYDLNGLLLDRGLERLDEMLRPAAMSGMISDMLTASLAKHARSLTTNRYFNGHPDLVVAGVYPNDTVQAGSEGVEVKSTRKAGGAVDTHGTRDQWICVFVYQVDNETEPARDRLPMSFTEVYLAQVTVGDFRLNRRGALGTRTATLHREGLQKLRSHWVYKDL